MRFSGISHPSWDLPLKLPQQCYIVSKSWRLQEETASCQCRSRNWCPLLLTTTPYLPSTRSSLSIKIFSTVVCTSAKTVHCHTAALFRFAIG
jgi:hypothetical protein